MQKYLFALLFLNVSFTGYSQLPGNLSGSQYSYETCSITDTNQNIRFSDYFLLLKSDLIRQAVSPFHLNGREWLKVGGFAGLTAGIMQGDEAIEHQAVHLYQTSGMLRAVSPWVTKFGGRYEVYLMGAIGAWSIVFKDQKLKTVTLLATQAYLTSGLWVSGLKFLTGRARPSYYDPNTGENEGAWHGMLYQFRRNSSGSRPDGGEFSAFPSGHAAAAFAVATVFAEQYRNKPWIPIIAYGSATLVALSRITENRHWASDVLVGSALGYLSGKQVVQNYLRFKKLDSFIHRKKNSLVFDVNYQNRIVTPSVVYTFR